MSEQFTFQEFCNFNWNRSVCLKSQKNLNFTMSDVSKNDFDSKLFPDEQQPLWNLEQFNKKAQKKLKNRMNVKNFRQRKKHQQEKLQKKMKFLEEENKFLKMQKFCRHCKRPFASLVQITHNQTEQQKENKDNPSTGKIKGQVQESFQFQKFDLFGKNKQLTNNRNGKIWIALGILMLVIGVHIYGFRGKQGYQDIIISKIESKKWINTFQNKANTLDQYFNVKVKLKQKESQKTNTQKEKQQGIFKQIRIFHQQDNSQKSKQYQSMTRETIQKLQMIEEDKEKIIGYQSLENNSNEQIRFHKELLFAIQAEIDDLGNYM